MTFGCTALPQPKFLTPMAVIAPIGQPTKPTDKVCQITPVLITNYHAAPDMSAKGNDNRMVEDRG